LIIPLALSLSSCATYRQNIMFRMPEGADTLRLKKAVNRAEQQYRVRPNDFLEVRVYTNKGERILDPNGELTFGNPGGLNMGSGTKTSSFGAAGQTISRTAASGSAPQQAPGNSEFLVQADGQVKLPMVDMVNVRGLTLLQVDSLLQVRYTKFYKDVYVASRVTNNRIIVLGSPGGQIVPMYNENMSVLEIIAAVGGLGGGTGVGAIGAGKAHNIRLIRGDLKNPEIQLIDLSTIDGMRKANLQVEPNDILYIEPVRQPFFEAFRDIAPIVTTFASLATALAVLATLRN
jgi:polysaccharide export outer membrane protein